MYKQRGLSLIELMISLTLGIVLMTGVVQMFLTSRVTYNTQQAVSRIQESGRMAMEFLASDVRMAGYMGCASRNPNLTNGLDSPDDYLYNFNVGIEGKEGDDFDPASDDTDVLIVRRASGDATTIVEEPETGGNARIRVTGTPYEQSSGKECLLDGALCDNDIAILSDCSQGRVFRATNISSPGAGAAGNGQINHGPSSPGGGSETSKLPKNLDSQLGGQEFSPGAEVLAFNTIAYYIAPSAFSPGGGVEVMSLWRRVGERDPAELVEGVENLKVEYGLDTTGNGIPDTYRPTDAMGSSDWNNAQAVRLHLLLQGHEPNVLPEAQTLSFAGSEETYGDGRMRQVFTSTVGIRGRLK